MEFPVTRVAPGSKGEQAAAQLRYEIIAGIRGPGEVLSENSIASACGVSRSPAREALRILKAEGLVSLERLGAVVSGMTETDVEELNDIRLLAERFAVERCAEKGDPSLLASLSYHIEQMRLALNRLDGVAFAFEDMAFHEAIIHASGHHRLRTVWEGMRRLILTAMIIATVRRFEEESGFEAYLMQTHVDIYEALRRQDAEAVSDCLQDHFADTRRAVEKSVSTTTKPGGDADD
ncbi:GntR family transcriptional regulator [Alkalicoccus urumqiensis]|uniref:GntR family transcriptional regulator n=1 Tax=Alkalicoccus urumqiensis TaxID=1548213 RepID=A0A2P6MJR1_ALKUR|nr:GntR family transcriptional regulator [Alkalicoccus urumqiensis]PRO66519.1 GntR family transcriptional regulator [Alkalicoccus urumqiensis]